MDTVPSNQTIDLKTKHGKTLIYYSRNGKKPPFEVTVEIVGRVVYINCNCPLGFEKKICRHKINAIRADRQHKAETTPDDVIEKLKKLFGPRSAVRQHLETNWRELRIYAAGNPENKDEIANRRRILGEAFANGFVNDRLYDNGKPFDFDAWESNRDVISKEFGCLVTLKYEDSFGFITIREVFVNEVILNDEQIYIGGYCHLRKENRTFRTDRIHEMTFDPRCPQRDKDELLAMIS